MACSLFLQLCVIIAVLNLLPHLQLVQGRHTHIHMALLKQLAAVAKQEGQKQCPDVRTVDICVCQQYHLRVHCTVRQALVSSAPPKLHWHAVLCIQHTFKLRRCTVAAHTRVSCVFVTSFPMMRRAECAIEQANSATNSNEREVCGVVRHKCKALQMQPKTLHRTIASKCAAHRSNVWLLNVEG